MAKTDEITIDVETLGRVVAKEVAEATEALRAEITRLSMPDKTPWSSMQSGDGRRGVRKLYKNDAWPDPLFDTGMNVKVKDDNEKEPLRGKVAVVTDVPHYHEHSKKWKYPLAFQKGVLGGAGTKERLYEHELVLA
jgi:hypothetical protein